MTSLPYFQFMVDDWLGGLICTHTMEHQGIFINICARLWKRGGYLDGNEDRLARMLRINKQMLSNCLILLKQDGIICFTSDGRLYIKFILAQLERFKDISAKRALAGSKGGKAFAKQLPLTACASEPEPEPESKIPPKAPKGAKRVLSKERKEQTRVKANTPLMVRIGKFLHRRAATLWTIADAERLKALGEIDEKELAGVERYYLENYGDKDVPLRTSLDRLLKYWHTTEVDRARRYVETHTRPQELPLETVR